MKWVWPLLAVAVAVGLFISSGTPGEASGAASMGIVDRLQDRLPFLRLINADTLHFLLRKGAHFVSYFFLGFFTVNALKYYLRGVRLYAVAWGIASLYGVADEIHQYFIPGRACLLSDMLINAAGAFFGVGLLYLWRWFSHRIQGDKSPAK